MTTLTPVLSAVHVLPAHVLPAAHVVPAQVLPAVHVVPAARLVLAAAQPGGQGPEFGSSGPVALALLVGLLIAVGFLVKSMSKHLKRVPASFDPPEAEQVQSGSAQSGSAQSGSAQSEVGQAEPGAAPDRGTAPDRGAPPASPSAASGQPGSPAQ